MAGDALGALPDTPLARAYKLVVAFGQEHGAAVLSNQGGGRAESNASERLAEERYNVTPEDLAGFCGGLSMWLQHLPGTNQDTRIQMAAMNALLTGIQFERDRLAEQRRAER